MVNRKDTASTTHIAMKYPGAFDADLLLETKEIEGYLNFKCHNYILQIFLFTFI